MEPSSNAYDIIMKFEFDGREPPLEAYWDKFARIWTIGWGHTKTAVRGMKITLDKAYLLLVSDVEEAVKAVNRLVKVKITQSMFDALVSFTFNVGCGNLAQSTLLRLLNEGNIEGAALEFLRWTYSGEPKRKVKGLINRREAERDLFLAGLPGITNKEVPPCHGQS